MPQLPPWGLSNIFPNHYHCEPNPIHLAMGALVCKSSSGPNRSRLGRQLSWCVVWGLLELVGWDGLYLSAIVGEEMLASLVDMFLAAGSIVEQDNKMLQWIHVVIYTWNGRHGSQCEESCGDLITSFPYFSRCFLPPPIEAWHGVTPSGGIEEWQPSALVRSQCHSHLVSCQVPEVLSCGKRNPEFIDVQTSSCADGHLGVYSPASLHLEHLVVSTSSWLHVSGTSRGVYKARLCGMCWWFASLSPLGRQTVCSRLCELDGSIRLLVPFVSGACNEYSNHGERQANHHHIPQRRALYTPRDISGLTPCSHEEMNTRILLNV